MRELDIMLLNAHGLAWIVSHFFVFVMLVVYLFVLFLFSLCDGCLELMFFSTLQGGIGASSSFFLHLFTMIFGGHPDLVDFNTHYLRLGEVHETLSLWFYCYIVSSS